ncbi:MAG: hypothetical protein ACTSRU_14540 [Candidatus Hodarchaeales archaeon]
MSTRKRCPKCNSARVKQREDRSQPIGHAFSGLGTPIYKKIWVCGECGEKFE